MITKMCNDVEKRQPRDYTSQHACRPQPNRLLLGLLLLLLLFLLSLSLLLLLLLLLFNRFAHSAGPGMVRQRVQWSGNGVDDLTRWSKWLVRYAI